MIGKTVAHYRIVSKLGEGGMGEVYLAEDTELDRQVALKFLPTRFANDADALERFKREARAAAALDHPNIITVHEIGTHEGHPYIAMAYVKGRTLTETVASGTLSSRRAIDIALQIVDGLAKAHAAGIVHRDLKPDNIVIDSDGRVKLLDFGLAKLGDLTKLTKEDSTVGTLYYMSPEQARGDEVDARTDLFSVGAILYEMITGQRAFDGEHAAAVHYAIANTSPQPLSRYSGEATPELERIVFKLLTKDPAERYQSAADLAADLRALQSSPSATTSASQPARRTFGRNVGIAAIVVVLVALGIVFNPFRKDGVRDAGARPMIVVLPFENLGSPDDDYFADGVTDEITSRLSGIGGLGVISRASAMRYKATEKALSDIARELGVGYILEGTIRWDKSGGTSRVRITPRLIRVSDDTNMWASNYERELVQIFEVQSDIATQVADAMELTLLEKERAVIEDKPTDNMEAYTYYLRGCEYVRDFSSYEQLWSAVDLLKRASNLDPDFAQAYAYEAIAHLNIYHEGVDRTTTRLGMAKAAADRAMAMRPDAVAPALAMAYYYYYGFKDYDQALEYLDFASRIHSEDPDVMVCYAWIHRRQGHFEQAVTDLRHCVELDPQNLGVWVGLVETYQRLRDFARADSCAQIGLTIAPNEELLHMYRALNQIANVGDTKAARRFIDDMPEVDANEWPYYRHIIYFMARDYRASLDVLTKSSSDDLSVEFFYRPNTLLAGLCYRMMGESEKATAAFDSARVHLEARIADNPSDARLHKSLGLALAGLGRNEEAIQYGRKAAEMSPVSRDAMTGYIYQYDLAVIYALAGQANEAVAILNEVLGQQNQYTVHIIAIEPLFDSIRDDPGYQELIARYSNTSS